MAFNSKANLATVKAIIARHYSESPPPKGLLIDLYKAVREAEMRGFDDCMSFFERTMPANDDAPT